MFVKVVVVIILIIWCSRLGLVVIGLGVLKLGVRVCMLLLLISFCVGLIFYRLFVVVGMCNDLLVLVLSVVFVSFSFIVIVLFDDELLGMVFVVRMLDGVL